MRSTLLAKPFCKLLHRPAIAVPASVCVIAQWFEAKAPYERLMEGAKADLVITDPPYNVVIDGHATGNGSIHHREFAMASGEMSSTEFTEFLRKAMLAA